MKTNTQSFLIISQNKKSGEAYALSVCQKHNIHPIDITYVIAEKSIGIEEVRTIQEKLSLKPITSSEKAIIIQDAQKITRVAQNALLKVLEEPPLHTLVFLVATDYDAFLETILSRCTLVSLTNTDNSLSLKDLDIFSKRVFSLSKAPIGERLAIAQEYSKTKEDALLFLEKSILSVRQVLISAVLSGQSTENKRVLKILHAFDQTHSRIKRSNVSPRLALEDVFLFN